MNRGDSMRRTALLQSLRRRSAGLSSVTVWALLASLSGVTPESGIVAALPEARAEDAPKTLSNILPPGLNPAVGSFSNLFTQCGLQNTVAPAVVTGIQAVRGKSTAGSLEQGCENFVDPGEIKDSCEAFTDSKTGAWKNAEFQAMLKSVASAEQSLSCRKEKLKQIDRELQCFKQGNLALEQQIAQIQAEYMRNMQTMQSHVAQMTAYVGDRDRQIGDIHERLEGGGIGGRVGIKALKEEAKGLLDASHDQVHKPGEGLRDRVQKAEWDRQRYQESKKMRSMALAIQCFKNEPVPTLKCYQRDKSGRNIAINVSAYEYAECATRGYHRLGKNGRLEIDAETAARADAQAANLRAKIDAIFSQAPTDPNVLSSAGQDGKGAPEQANRFLHPDAIDWKQLDSANRPEIKFNIRQVLEQAMRRCHKSREAQVEKEADTSGNGRSTSALAALAQTMRSNEATTQQMANRLVQNYELIHQKINATLTGSAVPLNTAQCRNSSPARQLACLEDAHAATDDLLQGKTPASEQTILIKANNPAMNIPITCRGLVGCETILTNAKVNLENDKQKVVQNKKDYIQKANQQIEAFTQQMAQNFSAQTAYLRDRLEKAKAALGAMGIRELGLSLDNVRPVELQKTQDRDGDGLYAMPTDLIGLIGGKAQPPMIKVDDLNSSIGGVAEAVKEYEGKATKIAEKSRALQNLEGSCKLALVGKQVDELRGASSQLSQCFETMQYDCDAAAREQLSKLSGKVEEITEKFGSATGSLLDIAGVLATATNSCKLAETRATAERARLQGLIDGAQTYKAKFAVVQEKTSEGIRAESQSDIELSNLRKQLADLSPTGQKGPSCLAVAGKMAKEIEDVRNKARSLSTTPGH
jgi:hypothetical protein